MTSPMKRIFRIAFAVAIITVFLCPVDSAAQRRRRDRSESEPFQWVMPPLSGNESVDLYLKSCDDTWNQTLEWTKSLTMYHIDTTYVKGDDGVTYKAFSLVDQNGERRSTSRVILQNIDLVLVGTNLILSMTDVGLGMASATLSLPELGLKAFEYGKYLKQGAQLLRECGQEVGRIVKEKKAETAAIKSMKQNAVDVGDIKSTDKVILNRLDEGEDVPEGVDIALLDSFDMGDDSEAVELDQKSLEELEKADLD